MMTSTTSVVFDELIELRGLRLHFREWPSSRPDAPTLVLVHGFAGHARSWDAFAQAMTDRYRVLALDQRGHGESSWASADQYSVEEMAADLEAFVKALTLTRFSLVGLSIGGLVTMIYAGGRPEALTSCVVIDFGPDVEAAGRNRIQSNVQATDAFDTRDQAFARARQENSRQPEALHRRRSDNGLMRTDDGRWTYRYDRALRAPGTLKLPDPASIWGSCATIEAPTLVVRGGLSDFLSPRIADQMVEVIADARLATVADAGHGVPYDAPDGFLAAMRSFLKE